MHAEHEHGELKRSLGATNLVLLGIGCIIGTGIFVLTGRAAAQFAGPAIMISFIITGTLCALVALSYAELASAIPGVGLRVLVLLCVARRVRRVDHGRAAGARVRPRRFDGRRRLVGLRRELPARPRARYSAGVTRGAWERRSPISRRATSVGIGRREPAGRRSRSPRSPACSCSACPNRRSSTTSSSRSRSRSSSRSSSSARST